ncbi:Bifunctional peptidase and (3S)-lysyl hydroxylase JMJD7 [Coccomyxa sp. Obi]|nr:Bifunctional peptidase and (3S)-lysyl hydroxylase JMJD7 [Coccomyxa sp. Obi]
MHRDAKDLLHQLTHEIRDLDIGYTVAKIPASQLTSLTFFREYVSRNKPVVITGAIDHWPALQAWNVDYIREKMGSAKICVARTPHGRADSVISSDGSQYFALPYEEHMPVQDFFAQLHSGSSGEKIYAQAQNNSLPEQFGALLPDVEEFDWATEAFGAPPEAANLWIGTDDSVTSFHKDHYENIYAVVKGRKVFTLLPPSDVYRLYFQTCQVARYNKDAEGTLVLQPEEPHHEVPWATVDPYPSSEEEEPASRAMHPEYWDPQLPPPLEVELGPGKVLYLPSLWYHHVRQQASADDDACVIAVNYWYEMAFDCKAAYAKLAEQLATALHSLPESNA